MRGLRKRFTYANVVASVAVFMALGGGAYAAVKLPTNSVDSSAIKAGAITNAKLAKGAVDASKIANGTITGAQINLASLGSVPQATHATSADQAGSATSAAHANTADSATTATNATHATTADSATTANSATTASHATTADSATTATTAANASQFGGHPVSAFQASVTGQCTGGSAITQVGEDGSVGCSNTQDYAARIQVPTNPTGPEETVLSIPGVAHVAVDSCTSNTAEPDLVNDAIGQTQEFDDWGGDAETGGTTWSATAPPGEQVGMVTWYLGSGYGANAEVITIEASYASGEDATNGECVFQAKATVVHAS